jgi:CheY-like chemotaxis protein/HPt (histidine-containing phosphotransfer) domain-containing protein
VVAGAATYREFVTDVARRVAAMELHLTAAVTDPDRAHGEIDAAHGHAHSIKGTAAVLGAGELATRASAIGQILETALGDSHPMPADRATELRRHLRELVTVAEASSDIHVESPPPSARPRSVGAAERTVLHIEDADIVAELMQALLEDRADIQLRRAATASHGLELARTLQPALVFLDMHLPDGSGEQVLGSLRADPATRAIPVVVVSGEDRAHEAERLVAAGATAFVTKPFPAAAVREIVDRHCPPA